MDVGSEIGLKVRFKFTDCYLCWVYFMKPINLVAVAKLEHSMERYSLRIPPFVSTPFSRPI